MSPGGACWLSSSPPSALGSCWMGPCGPRLWCRLEDDLGSSSVLMLTTAGPTSLTICEKPLDKVTGLGMISGRASEESTVCCSLPLTLRVSTEPANIPTERVPISTKVVVSRRLPETARRANSVFPEFVLRVEVSIAKSDLISCCSSCVARCHPGETALATLNPFDSPGCPG